MLRVVTFAVAACLLGATAVAQTPSAAAQARDLTNLKADVQQLKNQQQQILDSLEELKKRLLTRNGPPELKMPETMQVAGESFKGGADASVAIIEYADFECPFCRRFEHDTFPQIEAAYIGTGKVKF